MNLLEVLCATLILWVCGAAAAEAWLTSVREQALAEELNVACDGAEWAAERLLSGAGPADAFSENGWRCELSESFTSSTCTIRSVCGQAAETLVIPWLGGTPLMTAPPSAEPVSDFACSRPAAAWRRISEQAMPGKRRRSDGAVGTVVGLAPGVGRVVVGGVAVCVGVERGPEPG